MDFWLQFDCTDPPNLPQCIAGAEPGLILHPRLAAADVFNFILFHAKFGFVIYNFTTWWLVVGHKDKDYTRIKVLMTLWGMLIVVTWWSYGDQTRQSALIYNRSKVTVTASQSRGFHHFCRAEREWDWWKIFLCNSAWNSNDLYCCDVKYCLDDGCSLTRLLAALSKGG